MRCDYRQINENASEYEASVTNCGGKSDGDGLGRILTRWDDGTLVFVVRRIGWENRGTPYDFSRLFDY